MIDQVRGTLVHKSPTCVLIDVGGIGLAISIPLTTYESLNSDGSEILLITYLYVREDTLQLFGFRNAPERDLFVNLLGASGVGPKVALAILSRFTPHDLHEVIAGNDIRRFTTVPGIGKRIAERLILDLKTRLRVKDFIETGYPAGESSVAVAAIHALEALGYSPKSADDAVRRTMKKIGDDKSLEEIVKQALKG